MDWPSPELLIIVSFLFTFHCPSLKYNAGTPVPVLVIIMLPAPVNHDRALLLLIVIMLLAPVGKSLLCLPYRDQD